MKKKMRPEDLEHVQKGVGSQLPMGAKMALILPTEEWASGIQAMHQTVTGKSLEQLQHEMGDPCPMKTGRVQKCEDCQHYLEEIVPCSMRTFTDQKTGETRQGQAVCDYMFDSGDICVNCPSAQLLYLGIDCPCPKPGIYRHGEEDEDDYTEEELYDPDNCYYGDDQAP